MQGLGGDTEGFQRAIGKPFGRARRRDSPCFAKKEFGEEKSVSLPILRLNQHHRPQDTILIRVQTQRRIAPPRIIIRLPRA